MKSGVHTKTVSNAVLKDLRRSLERLIKALEPYASPLGGREKLKLPKVGEKGFLFLEKSHELAILHPGMFPNIYDLKEFKDDFKDVHE